ncbi:MAG: selenocysteine-specific translation elongation factor [bacterium]|nr:selenocysteine-specific translation elongation factor [bacterium]
MDGDNLYSQYTIGTAGHVDHGKSSLVKALTGYDPDVLKEEKERGLTIELGFTHLDLGDGISAGFIDVPGHEKFLRMAIAGVTGIDVVLFVIAADEGVMPQTIEHLAILDYLGCERGVIALTKSDMVEEEWLELMTEEVADFVRGSFLADSEIIPVSSPEGTGLGQLRAALKEQLKNVRIKSDDGPFRMPIDRVFTLRGFGTIVAGTVESGSAKVKDELEVQPLGQKARVRGIQSQHKDVPGVDTGVRAALNITGVDANDIERGFEITALNLMVPTDRLDVRLRVEPGQNVIHRQKVRFHKGTTEVMARLKLLEADIIEGGTSALCQLELEEPVVATRFEPFIIRHHSELNLMGGGTILDVFPTRHRRKDWVIKQISAIENAGGDINELLVALFKRKRGPYIAYDVTEIARELCLPEKDAARIADEAAKAEYIVKLGNEYLLPEDYEALLEKSVEAVGDLMGKDALKAEVGRDEIRGALGMEVSPHGIATVLGKLVAEGQLETVSAGYRIPGHSASLSDEHKKTLDAITAAANKSIMVDTKEIKSSLGRLSGYEQMFKYAVSRGLLVNLGEGYISHPDVIERQKDKIREYLTKNGTVRPADYKNVVNLSRKQVTLLLDYFYDIGVTVRESGTHRLPG